MKKSLIALAVAGVVSAPAFAATANVDVYGILNVAIQDTDASGSDIQVTDNFSRIGFKGSEDLGGGLKAVWQIETGLGSGLDGMGTSAVGTRNTFVGLAGGFGTFLMGRHDTPYKIATGKYDIFADTIGDYNLGRTGVNVIENTHDHRSPAAIAYISPSFSGLTIAAAVVATNNNALTHLNSGDSFDALSIAAMYANGPLTVDLAYQDVEVIDNQGLKLGVGYTMGDTKIGLVYEKTDGNVLVRDGDSWLVNVVHSMGPIALKASFGSVDSNLIDGDMWALGADYALSKRTSAYVVMSNGDVDGGADVDGWNIGVKHSF